MKATKKQALQHLNLLKEKETNFDGEIIFYKQANEWVVNEKTTNTHIHITDWIDEASDEEKKIFSFD